MRNLAKVGMCTHGRKLCDTEMCVISRKTEEVRKTYDEVMNSLRILRDNQEILFQTLMRELRLNVTRASLDPTNGALVAEKMITDLEISRGTSQRLTEHAFRLQGHLYKRGHEEDAVREIKVQLHDLYCQLRDSVADLRFMAAQLHTGMRRKGAYQLCQKRRDEQAERARQRHTESWVDDILIAAEEVDTEAPAAPLHAPSPS